MFSIIIPVYNKEKYIEKTIMSIKAQTFQEFEVIFIDDGSTDKSVELIKPFLNEAKFKIIQQPNSGVSAARNVGIAQAKYDFIAFLDADDLWHPQYLEEHKNAWIQFNDVSIIGSKYIKVEEGNEVIFDFENRPKAYEIEDYFKYAEKDLLFWTSSLTIKKQVFEKMAKAFIQ